MQKPWLLLAAALAIPAQPAKPSAPVSMQFHALTDDGQPVTDLKAGELALKVNGKPRSLSSLTLVQSSSMGADESNLPLPYATNGLTRSGRVFYVLIDDDSITTGREGQMKDALRALTTEMAANDRIGVVTTQGGVNISPVDDRSKITVAVDGISGKSSANESTQDAQCRTTRVLGDLGTMLAAGGSASMNVLLFSSGLSAPAEQVVQVGSRARTPGGGSAGTSDLCPVRPVDYENLGRLASATNSEFYVFDLTQGAASHSSSQDDGLSSLASVTGGEFVAIGGNAQSAMSRLLRETSAYYVASFDADQSERNGQAQRVELKSTREHVDVRARQSIVIPKEGNGKTASPKDMLRVATVYRDLPLRAAGYDSRNAGSDELKVVGVFEPVDPSTQIASASVALFDEKNTLKKQWTAQPADLTKHPVIAGITATPGSYRLRVAAVDSSGRAGTVDYPLTVELPRADPLKVSSLVLGTQADGKFAPRLDFRDERVAIGYLEIYGVPKGGKVGLNLDVAKTNEGAALASADTTVGAGSAEDVRVAYGGFSIDNLEPGDYLMRAVVTLDGKPVGRVVRTLRKSK